MYSNTDLHKAKYNKNDEFYTTYEDIEKELSHYNFKNKIIYCNCDDYRQSNFVTYFIANFDKLGINKLFTTCFIKGSNGLKFEFDGVNNSVVALDNDGDFRSEECIEILKQSDIIITNPPFSLFRQFVKTLTDYDKQFIILGNMTAITYKEIFPLIRDNKLWYGATIHSGDRKFYIPDDYPLKANTCGIDENNKRFIRVKGVRWFTNIDYKEKHQNLILSKKYNEQDYPKYENYDAINVNKTKDIPIDYNGVMGVPITFIDKYNPEQFEILGMSASWDNSDAMKQIRTSKTKKHGPILNNKEIYRRIFIKKQKGLLNK